jgi:iron complex transport system permease protein
MATPPAGGAPRRPAGPVDDPPRPTADVAACRPPAAATSPVGVDRVRPPVATDLLPPGQRENHSQISAAPARTLPAPPVDRPSTVDAQPAPAPARAHGRFALLLVALGAVVAVSIVLGVALGSVRIPPLRVWEVAWSQALGAPLADDVPRSHVNIVWELRLPRTLVAAMVGAGLALVGVAIQALVRNPLADPYILGVSSGASVGAALVILFGWLAALGIWALSGAAFLGAMGAMAVVWLVAQEDGRLSPLRLVLGGVAAGYVFAGVTSFLIFQVDPRASDAVLFWLLGSFGRARWAYVVPPAVVLALGAAWLLSQGRALNALVAGEDTATTLGVPVARLRASLFVVTAAMTGVMVAVSGAVGFVGLILPHVARLVVGADHRRVLPVAALLGATFTIWVDVAARTLVAPQELPVGVLTAVVGGPIFVVLLRRRMRVVGAAS